MPHRADRPRPLRLALRSLALGFALTLAGVAPRAGAADPRPAVTGLAVERGADGAAHVHFHAEPLFDQSARDAIDSGIVAVVEVAWDIERPRTLWFDETLDRNRETRKLSYDNVTKRYRVEVSPSARGGLHETSSFEEAQRWLGTVDAPLPVELLASPGVGDRVLKVRMSCDSRDGMLPLGLEKVLFFLPGWGFDTGWVSVPLE